MKAIVGYSAKEAVQWLHLGEPVALPTETVYGLAAPLSEETTIKKIYTLKRRPIENPLIVHVLNTQQLEEIAFVSTTASTLAENYWPGPLTLVLKKKDCVPNIVTGGLPSVAVRAPQAPLFREVISLLKEPLVAPSANTFQQLSPTTAQHVLQDLGSEISYILDGGPCTFGLESTILSLLDEEKPTLLRHGPITKEALESFLQKPIIDGTSIQVHLSPGLYKKHYSPKKPLYWVQRLEGFIPSKFYEKQFKENAAHVFLYPPQHKLQPNEYVLSPSKSLQEVATHLFKCLQTLDKENWSSIWIEKAPDYGIGKAINDRLSRAAHFNLTI